MSQADIDTLRTWVQNGTRAGAVGDTCLDAGGPAAPRRFRRIASKRTHCGLTTAAPVTRRSPRATSGDLGNEYVCSCFKPPYAAGCGAHWSG